MTTPLTLNRLGAVPTAETIPLGGPIGESRVAVGAGLTSVLGWFDLAAWGTFRAQLNVTAFGGTLAVQYSLDDAHAVLIAGVALPPVVAGVPYDTGWINPVQGAQWALVTYTQAGGGASGAFLFRVLVPPNGGAGGGGGVIVNVALQGQIESLPAPSPSSIRGALADLALLEEPDHALRTRARVLTDEGSFADDFAENLGFALTGTSLFTTGLTTVVGTGSLYTTELKQGDYVELAADHSLLAPKLMQVLSVQDATHLTLVAPYAGAGGPTGVAARYRWWLECGAGATITRPGGTTNCRLAPGVVPGEQARIVRQFFLGAPAKGSQPFDVVFRAALDVRRAGQMSWLAVNTLTGGVARFFFDGGDAAGLVYCESRSANDVAATLSRQKSIPVAGVASAMHLYRMRIRADRVDFWIDDGDGGWSLVDGHPWHVPYPYDGCNIEILTEASAAGVTLFDVDLAIIEDLDSVKAEVEQMDATKLHATVKDATPEGPSTATTTAVAVNVVVNIAATVAGERYRFSVDGGAGFCIRVDGVDPVVTDECWYDGMKLSFTATVTSASGVRAIKKTAATADGSVTVARRV